MLPFEPKIIFVNGPPCAGKDTVSQILNDLINLQSFCTAQITKFTAPMDHIIADVWESCYLADKFTFQQIREDKKDQPVMHSGTVPRQCLIDLSEKWFKPYFGPTIFGRLAASQINQYNPEHSRTFIFSDSGFYPEAYGLVGALETITPAEMIVIQVHRDGCSFEGDSRSWLDLQDLGIPLIKLNNSGTLEDLKDLCYNLFHDLFIQQPDPTKLIVNKNETINHPGSGLLDTAGPVYDVALSGETVTPATTGCDDDCGKGDDNTNLPTSKQ